MDRRSVRLERWDGRALVRPGDGLHLPLPRGLRRRHRGIDRREGVASFEDDGNPLDGWTATGPPATSPGNDNDWIVGSTGDAPANFGVVAEASFARQDEIIAFEEGLFGPYPFETTGGVLDEGPFQFALEVQTRPVYATAFFSNPNEPDDSVVVHELAHQWVGDSLAVERWSEIWLNEGFATYTEWLWSEHEGLGTAQEIFDEFYEGTPEARSGAS